MDILILVFLAVLVLGVTFMTIVLATFTFTHIFGAPYVGTPKEIARKMLEFAELEEGGTFLDLGSGTGTFLLAAVQEFKASKAIGYEINPILVWYSNVRAQLAGRSKKMVTLRKNFFKAKLPNVDLVALYLWPETMDKVREKLKKELDPDVKIVSRGFVFSNIEPEKSVETDLAQFHLYRVRDL